MLNPKIIKAVAVTAELTGATLSDTGTEALVEHLSAYDTDAVLEALHRCQLELRSPLTLGAVMDRLDDGHPGPESAWAIVAHLGEDDSVVWTEEIAQAWGRVRHLISSNDRVAARMAFLEEYRRRLAKARSQQRPAIWWASLGYDPQGRAGVLAEAVEAGRLTIGVVRSMLPPHEWPVDIAKAVPALPSPKGNA